MDDCRPGFGLVWIGELQSKLETVDPAEIDALVLDLAGWSDTPENRKLLHASDDNPVVDSAPSS